MKQVTVKAKIRCSKPSGKCHHRSEEGWSGQMDFAGLECGVNYSMAVLVTSTIKKNGVLAVVSEI